LRAYSTFSGGGAMVDTPVYVRARRILEYAEAIAAVEKRKADARARSG